MEMQAAARRVNEENKLLRIENQNLKDENALLREMLDGLGMGDTEIRNGFDQSKSSTSASSAPALPRSDSMQLDISSSLLGSTPRVARSGEELQIFAGYLNNVNVIPFAGWPATCVGFQG
jgi:hypothetical protein